MKTIDQGIIDLLKKDARMTVTKLATELGVSRITIDNHIKALEQNRIITGYTVRLGKEDFNQRVSGWVMIVASANGEEAVIIQLRNMREIVKIFTTNGRWDLAVEIETHSLVEFDQALSKLRQVKGIEETQTSLLLSARH